MPRIDATHYLNPDECAVHRDWLSQRGAALHERVLEGRAAELKKDMERQVLVGCEDARRDFRWKMGAQEAIEEVKNAMRTER